MVHDVYSLNLNQSKSTDYQRKLTDSPMKNILHWFDQWKLTYSLVKNILHWFDQWKLTDLTVKRQITDSISENFTDSDL